MAPMITKIFYRSTLIALIVLMPVFSQTVDLSTENKYFKSGFQPEWALEQPGVATGWFSIKDFGGERFPAYVDIDHPQKQIRPALSLKKYDDVRFTISVPFHFPGMQSDKSYALTIKSISFNWEIYLNGILVNSNWSSADLLAGPIRGKNLSIPLPSSALKDKNNLLVFRIKGPPHHRWTGFYYGSPVGISAVDQRLFPKNDIFMLSMMAVLILLGIFWTVIAVIDQKTNLFVFAGWCLAYALFFFTRLDHLWQFQTSGYLMVRIEHITFYVSSLLFPLFLDTYQSRISLFTKYFGAIQLFFVFLTLIVPMSFLFDINYVWQRMILLVAVYIMCQMGVYVRTLEPVRFSRFIQSGLGIIFLAMILHVGVAISDVIEFRVEYRDDLLSRYSMVFSTLIISAVLARDFVRRYIESRGLEERLGVEAEIQNQELRQTKDYLESVFNNSGEGIAVFNLKINIIQCNQAYLDLFGYTFDEYKNLTLSDLYDGDGVQMLLDARKKALASGLLRLIVTVITKSGELRKISITGNQTGVLGGQKYFITNVFDLTERIEMENQLRKSKEGLEISEKKLLQLVDRLNEQGRALRKTSGRILAAQENERGRISRELHDEVGQTLTAIDLNLERLKQPKENQKLILDECQSLVQTASKEIHRFSRDLRPAILDDMGLFPAITSFIRSFEKRTDIMVNFTPPEEKVAFSTNISILIYRIFQEALTNASKHANAAAVSVEYAHADNIISLLFSDDGVGFPADYNEAGSDQLGLQGINERVQLAGGRFSVSSSINGGAELNVEIPTTNV